MSISTGLPPIPHPDTRPNKQAGPLVVQLVWNGDHEKGAQSIGSYREFGPFQSVWIWADTIMAREFDNTTEHSIASYRVSKEHGGGVWKAADDLHYTDVVFYYVGQERAVDPWRHERLEDWQYAVSNGDTLRSFNEWLTEEVDDE